MALTPRSWKAAATLATEPQNPTPGSVTKGGHVSTAAFSIIYLEWKQPPFTHEENSTLQYIHSGLLLGHGPPTTHGTKWEKPDRGQARPSLHLQNVPKGKPTGTGQSSASHGPMGGRWGGTTMDLGLFGVTERSWHVQDDKHTAL